MKRKEPFERVTYYTVEEMVKEGEEPQWMTEWSVEITEDKDEWLRDVRGNLDTKPEFKFTKHTVSGHEYNKNEIYDSPYDDDSNRMLNEDCPECGHLVVLACTYDDNGKYCSSHECDYHDEKHKEHRKGFEIDRNGPDTTLYIHGETPEEFAKKHEIAIDKVKDRSCAKCKKELIYDKCFMTREGIYWLGAHCECGNKPAISGPINF